MNDEQERQTSSKSNSSRSGAHQTTMVCCALMLLPVVWFFLTSGSWGAGGESMAAFAPLLLCVGAHFVMHKMMSKSCHPPEKKSAQAEQPVQEVASTVPSVHRG